MAKNKNLLNAKKAKNDEFYTKLYDIENELQHYRVYFKDSVVYCNCDNPFESKFVQYFILHFNELGLKKLISTCFGTECEMLPNLELEIPEMVRTAYGFEVLQVRADLTGEELIKQTLQDNPPYKLHGSGSFTSEKSLKFLAEADIVVTNPPFSLFRKFFSQLMEKKKKFLIIGNQNSAACKEVFPFFQNGTAWLGVNSRGMKFDVPEFFIDQSTREKVYNDKREVELGNTCWYTNLKPDVERPFLNPTEHYLVRNYKKYDNCNAIDVPKLKLIPKDYDGVMGVPVTFLAKHNPNEFELLGCRVGDDGKALRIFTDYPFTRILIRKLNVNHE